MRQFLTRVPTIAIAFFLAAATSLFADDQKPETSNHMFGVLPNYSTVDRAADAPPLTTRQTFATAALNSFDPYVFPLVAVTTGFGQGGDGDYPRRYATALADNAIGNFMTSAVMPTLLRQDPRYYQSGRGSIMRRAAYAASRSIVTRGRGGRTEFNYSEIGGNFAAAAFSNAYYRPEARSAAATLTRWGTQVMWDTLSNEMKEFWPDLRAFMKRDPIRK